MSRSELLNDYEALRELQKAFEEGATLSKPSPRGGFHEMRARGRSRIPSR
jgi:hypothetical protein